MIVASALVVMLSMPVPSHVTEEQAWAALAKRELSRGDACDAFFYRLRVYERTKTEAAAYYAFQTAYAADMLVVASKLLTRINDPKLVAVLDANKRELADRASVGALRDSACPAHRPLCGDLIVEGVEVDDDADAVGGSGHSVCHERVVPAPPRPKLTAEERAKLAALPRPDTPAPTQADYVVGAIVAAYCAAAVGMCAFCSSVLPP